MVNIPSITDFASALTSDCDSFRTLSGFSVECRDGRAVVTRTSLFAEAVIAKNGVRYLLCLPVRPESLESVAAALHLVRGIGAGLLTEYRILPDEFSYTDSCGNPCCCDLLLHRLPEGESLDEAVTHQQTAMLLAALDELKTGFVSRSVRHRNLKPSNLIYGFDGRMYAIRPHYLASESDTAVICEEFAAVEKFIRSQPEILSSEDTCCRCEEPSTFDELCPPRDMMRLVRRGELFGYADAEGCTVIEPRFTYAEEFFENRAVVELERGRMGVIDRSGNFIIPPDYDMVRFTDDETFRVRSGELVGEFDYSGAVVTPLQPNLPFEDIL